MKSALLIVFISIVNIGWTQYVFHQDVFRGGITAGGFSTGMGIGSGTVQLYIEPGSTIRKAFVFAYSTGENTTGSFLLNNTTYSISSFNKILSFTNPNTSFTPINIHCIEITHELSVIPTSTYFFETKIHPVAFPFFRQSLNINILF